MIRHFRLLAWLRWKYLVRAGGRTRKAGAVFSILGSIIVAAFLYLGLRRMLDFESAPHRTMWELVHLAFTVVYVSWLYTGSFNDLYDPSRLAPFPVHPRTLFLGSTLSSFIGIASIFGGALAAGFLSEVPGAPLQQAVRIALIVGLLVHLQMTSRLIRLTFLALLTSRRWRDAAMMISALVGGGLYIAFQLLPKPALDKLLASIFGFAEAGGPSAWFAWCPAVWFSWAFQLEGLRSVAGLGAFLTLTLLIHRAGGWAENRLAFSEPVFSHRRKKSAAIKRAPFLGGVSRTLQRIGGSVAAAVARKELAVFFRDPAIRHRILSSVFYILIPFAALFVVRTPMPGRRIELELGGFFLIFAEMFFLTNLFGVEGVAVRNLLWFPAPRRQILFGKNLAYFVLFGPFNAAVLVAIALFTGSIEKAGLGVALHFSALIVVMALGNVTSVYFPFPFLAPGQRMPRRDENGCLLVLARAFLYLATFILFSPVIAASAVLHEPPWTWLAALGGLVYSAGLYLFALNVSERALLEREEALGDYFRAA